MKTLLLFGLFITLPAFAKMDFTFSQHTGNLVVVDSFNNVGKSELTVESINKLIEHNRRLQQQLEYLNRQLELQKKITSQVEQLRIKVEKLERQIKK